MLSHSPGAEKGGIKQDILVHRFYSLRSPFFFVSVLVWLKSNLPFLGEPPTWERKSLLSNTTIWCDDVGRSTQPCYPSVVYTGTSAPLSFCDQVVLNRYNNVANTQKKKKKKNSGLKGTVSWIGGFIGTENFFRVQMVWEAFCRPPPSLLTNYVQRSVCSFPSCARWLNFLKKLFCQIDRGGGGGKGPEPPLPSHVTRQYNTYFGNMVKYPICQKSGEAPSLVSEFRKL